MTILDIILLLCFVPALIQGVSKGIVKQAASLLALVLGIWASIRYSELLTGPVSSWLTDTDPKVVSIICFALLFLLVLILTGIIGILITKIVKFSGLGWLNRLLGVVFAVFKTALILALLVGVFNHVNCNWNFVDSARLAESHVYQLLLNFYGILESCLESYL